MNFPSHGTKTLALALLACAAAGFYPLRAADQAPDEREFSEVMELLKSRYADPGAIADNKVGNAALNAVINKLGGGAVLLTEPSLATTSPRPILMQWLPDKVGYLRMATFKPAKDWAQIETQIAEWQKGGAIGLVLDVRDFESGNDYPGAARAVSLFTPAGQMLFSVQGLQIPQQVYRSEGNKKPVSLPLVVLTNHRTMGAAEAFAAALRADAKAIVVGRSTAGQAGLFTEIKLNSGRYLRLATGQAILADGTQLFGKPVVPDIALYIDDKNERLALEESNRGNAAKLARELPSRAHTSEAALVHDETPELDEMLSEQLAAHKPGDSPDDAPMQDVALIRGMDVLRSIQFAESQEQGSPYLTTKK